MLSPAAAAFGTDSAGWLPVPLRLVRAVRREFAPRRDPSPDDALLTRYYTDMAASYGMPYNAEVRARASHNSFLEMGQALIPALTEPDTAVDLVVVAHHTPDVHPLRSASCYLASIVPGTPTAFTVSQNGVMAPFTALRLVAALSGPHGRVRRALLLTVDRSTVMCDRGVPPALRPTADVAVGLRFDAVPPPGAGEGAALAVSHRTDVHPECVRDALRDALDGVVSGLVAGHGIAASDLDDLTRWTHRPPAGMPSAAVWWVMAGPDAVTDATGNRLVLAEYDPGLRLLALLTVDGPVGTSPRVGPGGVAA